MLGTIFEQFVEHSPVSVIVRGLMEKTFAPLALDRIFEANAKVQYTRELLFSSLVELMSGCVACPPGTGGQVTHPVVCGIHPSVNAAYKAKAQQLNVSRTAIYDKRGRCRTSGECGSTERNGCCHGEFD